MASPSYRCGIFISRLNLSPWVCAVYFHPDSSKASVSIGFKLLFYKEPIFFHLWSKQTPYFSQKYWKYWKNMYNYIWIIKFFHFYLLFTSVNQDQFGENNKVKPSTVLQILLRFEFMHRRFQTIAHTCNFIIS